MTSLVELQNRFFLGCLFKMSQRLCHACLSISDCMDFDFTIFTLYNILVSGITFCNIHISRYSHFTIFTYSYITCHIILSFQVLTLSLLYEIGQHIGSFKVRPPKYEFPLQRGFGSSCLLLFVHQTWLQRLVSLIFTL